MDWLKEILEQADITDGKLDITGILNAVKTEFPKNAVPKAVFNSLNQEKKRLKTDVSSKEEQLEEMKKIIENTKELEQQIEKLQKERKVWIYLQKEWNQGEGTVTETYQECQNMLESEIKKYLEVCVNDKFNN